jgi:UDP-2-acetamido-2,6-beta-L-arabino-hexul-4-ose reductase
MFEDPRRLAAFVASCETVVHLAGMNRGSEQEVYETNVTLARELVAALQIKRSSTHVIFSSSTQYNLDNPYGRSKMEAQSMLEAWAKATANRVTTLIIPNVFGPFCRPFYNSVIATFCYQLTHQQEPRVIKDADLQLIYVQTVVNDIIDVIMNRPNDECSMIHVQEDVCLSVSEMLQKLSQYKRSYFDEGIIPKLDERIDVALFNTLRSYVDDDFFPVKLKCHSDGRGYLFENVKAHSGGQTYVSVTKPNITRGNHFHLRKIERFCVVSGEAMIRLRKIGTQKIIEYRVCGDEPSFVDMPIYYTHSITNCGTSDLITLFWSNEIFDANDPDTYAENVA